MTSNRFPPYYDLCLRCREKGLDQVAEFIHELVNERELLRDALRWAAPYVQDDPRVSAIIKATLKESE